MLDDRDFGYAVMSSDLSAYSLESIDFNTCKRYCRNGDVIVERIPVHKGYSIRIMIHKFYKPLSFRFNYKNVLWFHFSISKQYLHKCGKVVYKS